MTLKEICSIMEKNRRGVNFLGKSAKNKKPVHPVLPSIHDVTVRFEWADPFGGWTGQTLMENFAWKDVIPAMDSIERNVYHLSEDCRTRAMDMADTEHCPMMTYDQKSRTLTMYFTSDKETAGRLHRYTMTDDITTFMSDFKRIDNLTEAYVTKVITHKTALNTGRSSHYNINEGETRGQFLHRISDAIAEKGYSRLFTEVVYNSKGKPTLFFWVCRQATVTQVQSTVSAPVIPDGYIDTDIATARHAEITQLLLSSKFCGPDTITKTTDFLYNAAKTVLSSDGSIGQVSDGYHTFDELYHHRACLFATLCRLMPDRAWKSKQHDDPNFPMFDGMFICGISTPDGQATYHYDIDPYWEMFDVKELDRAPKYDGHTPAQAIERILSLGLLSKDGHSTIEYRNAFTKACDEFLLDGWKHNSREYNIHTTFYVDGCDMKRNNTFIVAFRFPGATRGHVVIDCDTGRVKTVQFYDTAYENKGVACYSPDIRSLILKWEGGMMSELAAWCKRQCYGWEIDSDDGIRAR